MSLYALLLLAATPSTLGLDGGLALDAERWGSHQNPAALSFGHRYLYMGGVQRQLTNSDYRLALGAVDPVSGPVAGSLGLLVDRPKGDLLGELAVGMRISPQLAAGLGVVRPGTDWSRVSGRSGLALVQGRTLLGLHYDFSKEALPSPWTFSVLQVAAQGRLRFGADLKTDLAARLAGSFSARTFRMEAGASLDSDQQPTSFSFALDYLERGGWLGLAYQRRLDSNESSLSFRFAAQLRKRAP